MKCRFIIFHIIYIRIIYINCIRLNTLYVSKKVEQILLLGRYFGYTALEITSSKIWRWKSIFSLHLLPFSQCGVWPERTTREMHFRVFPRRSRTTYVTLRRRKRRGVDVLHSTGRPRRRLWQTTPLVVSEWKNGRASDYREPLLSLKLVLPGLL